MIIDNSKVVVHDRKLMYMMAISLTVIVAIICLSDFFDNTVLGLSREVYVIGICAIYVLYALYRFALNLSYFYFSDQGEKIIFRYYSLRPFMEKHRTIEMPKGTLLDFEIKKSIAGHKKDLILYQKINNKTAKYPPISISALNEEESENLVKALDFNILSK